MSNSFPTHQNKYAFLYNKSTHKSTFINQHIKCITYLPLPPPPPTLCNIRNSQGL